MKVALMFALWAFSGSAATAASLGGTTFVLDPGHGARYPDGTPLNVGAVGVGGVQEQRVTLEIAEDLAALLRASGARVVLTRSQRVPFRIGTNRARDNRARAALANRLHATAFLAIHADSSVDPQAHGTSVFWLHGNSVAFAKALRTQLATLRLGEAAFYARNLAVTDEARVPAALVELGFVSNARDARLLATPAFEEREARALYAAIAATFER